jgi:hypothetical protein
MLLSNEQRFKNQNDGKSEDAARRKLFAAKEEATTDLASSEDSNNNILGPSGLTCSNSVEIEGMSDNCQKPAATEKEEPLVLDLCQSQTTPGRVDLCDSPAVTRHDAPQEVINLDLDDDDEVIVERENWG